MSRPPRLPLPRPVLSPLLAGTLWLLWPREARAEDAASYKFQSWREEDGRITVDAHYALLETDLGPETRVKAMGVLDSIAGATPTGEIAAPGAPIPVDQMRDLRRAWDLNVAHQFPRVNLSASYGVSQESDYVSHGWSTNALVDFNQKNTTLLLGYGRTDDTIQPDFWAESLGKAGNDYIAGLTQLLSPATSVTANLSFGVSNGYLADPYKVVSKTVLFDPGVPGFPPIPIPSTSPENRPGHKEKLTLFLGATHHFDSLDAALEGSYRFYHDTFGIESHTVGLAWVQRLGERWIVQPSARYYRQGAADFYHYDLDKTSITPRTDASSPAGPGATGFDDGVYYSSDHRLAEMSTISLGLKVVCQLRPWLSVDAAYDRYIARGLDGTTPQALFADADVVTLGVRLSR